MEMRKDIPMEMSKDIPMDMPKDNPMDMPMSAPAAPSVRAGTPDASVCTAIAIGDILVSLAVWIVVTVLFLMSLGPLFFPLRVAPPPHSPNSREGEGRA